MTPKQELIKSTEELIKKSQDSERVSRVVGYGSVAIGGACMLLAIVMAVRENYDYAIINGLVGALNLYLGGANIQRAKTCRGNIQKLIKSNQALEKPRW